MTEPLPPGFPAGAYGAPAGPPPGGYLVPAYGFPLHVDPLISPDYSGWWQRATTIVKRGWRPLVLLQAAGAVAGMAVQIPIGIYSALASPDLGSFTTTNSGSTSLPDLAPVFAVLGYTFLAAIASVILTAVVTIAAIHLAVMIVGGGQPDLKGAIGGAMRRVFPLIGWQILAGLIILAGICACLLPAIYFGAVFAVLPAVVAFERGNTIGRCFKLFHGDLGSSVARVATIWGLSLAAGVVSGVLGAIVDVLAGGSSAGSVTIATTVVGVVVSTTVTVVISGAVAVLTAPLTLTTYADMRARIEPLSTTVLAQELGLSVSTGPTWPSTSGAW